MSDIILNRAREAYNDLLEEEKLWGHCRHERRFTESLGAALEHIEKLERALGQLGSILSGIDWRDSDHMPFDEHVIVQWWRQEVRPLLDPNAECM